MPDGAVPGFTTDGMKVPQKADANAEERGDPSLGLYEEEGLGCAKLLDVQTELIDASDSTPRAWKAEVMPRRESREMLSHHV